MEMRKAWLIGCLAVLFALAACHPEEPHHTIVVLGSESYVIPMWELIPDTLQQAFFDDFGIVPDEGYFPPSIEGAYRIGRKQFVASSLHYDLSDTLDMYLKVVDQHNRVARVEFYEGGSVWTETAFVAGTGQQFSLYFVETRELTSYGTTHAHDRFVLFTGSIGADGIRNLRFGSMILSAANGEDQYVGAFIPGWYFIYKDGDGLSEPTDFFNQEEGDDD
ncbi:MAG: hypothetical protein J6X40_03950 [Bacteroidales bacterium]|nr:hypothetical protein [Bacteroidales bacterium]